MEGGVRARDRYIYVFKSLDFGFDDEKKQIVAAPCLCVR